MAGLAPTEIQHIDQKAANSVEQATGQPTTPASLKPGDETALAKIEEEIIDFVRYYGSQAGEAVGGKERDADVMTSGGNEAIKIARNKGFKARFLQKLGLQKAA